MKVAGVTAVAQKTGSGRVFTRFITLTHEKGRWKAEFRGSEKAIPSARTGVDKEDFVEFLEDLKFEEVRPEDFRGEKKGVKAVYTTDNDCFFEISMIYAYVMRVLRKEERKKLRRGIIETLFRIHPHELIFWNHHFSRSKDRYAQDRVARAFLILYDLR